MRKMSTSIHAERSTRIRSTCTSIGQVTSVQSLISTQHLFQSFEDSLVLVHAVLDVVRLANLVHHVDEPLLLVVEGLAAGDALKLTEAQLSILVLRVGVRRGKEMRGERVVGMCMYSRYSSAVGRCGRQTEFVTSVVTAVMHVDRFRKQGSERL